MGTGSENSAQRQFGEAAAVAILAAVTSDAMAVERWEVDGPRWAYENSTPTWVTKYTGQVADCDIVLTRSEASGGGVTRWIEVLAPDGAALGFQFSSNSGTTVARVVDAVGEQVEGRLVPLRSTVLAQLENLAKPGRDLG